WGGRSDSRGSPAASAVGRGCCPMTRPPPARSDAAIPIHVLRFIGAPLLPKSRESIGFCFACQARSLLLSAFPILCFCGGVPGSDVPQSAPLGARAPRHPGVPPVVGDNAARARRFADAGETAPPEFTGVRHNRYFIGNADHHSVELGFEN